VGSLRAGEGSLRAGEGSLRAEEGAQVGWVALGLCRMRRGLEGMRRRIR